MNKQEINEKIQMLKSFIDEAREEGLNNIANLYDEELQSVIAMAKFDGRIEA